MATVRQLLRAGAVVTFVLLTAALPSTPRATLGSADPGMRRVREPRRPT